MIGLSKQEAENALRKTGLEISLKYLETDNKALAGKIARQEPSAGVKLFRQYLVTVTIYQFGGGTVIMPNLVGLNVHDAKDKLIKTSSELAANSVFKEIKTSDAKLHDKIALQAPPAGRKVRANNNVLVTVYKWTEPAQVEVPNVLGLTLEKARDNLHSLALNANIDSTLEVTNQREKNNTVAVQTPVAGTKVKPTTAIKLKIYRYNDPAQVPAEVLVPLVVNKSVSEAKQLLEQRGFQVTLATVPIPTQQPHQDGKVAKQSVTGVQKRGTKIELTVFKAVKMPR